MAGATDTHPRDVEFMQRAIALGEGARATCGPNPWVGCVVVARGEVVGEGAYVEDGGPHAEPRALAAAGDRAAEATAYVTLEPCNHHGRTPPCTEALIDAGIERVVVGVADPDERVTGSGVERLRRAGVTVDVGIHREAIEESLGPYLHQRATGRPWCVLKTAASIDGRTAAADGSSRWITGPEARADAHRLRGRSNALVVGSGTAIADRPSLTVRDIEPLPPRPPLRVLLDARGRTPCDGPLFDVEAAPTLVVTTAAADADVLAAWKAAGAEVEEVAPGPSRGVELDDVIGLLGRRGLIQAVFEGGAAVHGSLLAGGHADEIVAYLGPKVLGEGGRPMFAGVDVPTIDDAPDWRLVAVDRLGDDARLTWRPV